jgi:hypothetical protein
MWDGPIQLKALLIGASLEAIAIAPALLSTWGHAGPESVWGWLGLLLSVPALCVIWLLRIVTGSRDSISVVGAVTYIYLIQTLMFAYLTFVWLRWKKLKR